MRNGWGLVLLLAMTGCGEDPGGRSALPGDGDATGYDLADVIDFAIAPDFGRPLQGCGGESGLQRGAPWPMAGRCPSRQARSPIIGPRAPKLRWSHPTGGNIQGTATIAADGTVYVTSEDGYLYALDGASGTEHFRVSIGEYPSQPLIAADGTVYVGGLDGVFFAVDGASGAERWMVDVGVKPDGWWTSIGRDGTLYLSVGNDHLAALDPKSGATKWTITFPGAPHADLGSCAAMDDAGTLYVGIGDGMMLSLDGATGALRWSMPTNVISGCPALAPDGSLVVASLDGVLRALDPDRGATLWSFSLGSKAGRRMFAIAPDGTIVVAGSSGTVYAIDPASHAERWRFVMQATGAGVPTIGGDGTVYVGGSIRGQNGTTVYALDGASGAVLWSFPIEGVDAPPSIGADGTLYFGSTDHKVYALHD